MLIILWLALTHFMPLFLSTPPLSKRPENWRFSVVFRGYRKRPTVWNGLKLTLPNADLKFWGWFLQSPVSYKKLPKSLTETLKATRKFLKLLTYIKNEINLFAYLRLMFPSYRHQSVDLQSKSTDWFLYDGNVGREKVNTSLFEYFILKIMSIIVQIKPKHCKKMLLHVQRKNLSEMSAKKETEKL